MQTFINRHVLKRSTLSPLMLPRLELYGGARVPAVVGGGLVILKTACVVEPSAPRHA